MTRGRSGILGGMKCAEQLGDMGREHAACGRDNALPDAAEENAMLHKVKEEPIEAIKAVEDSLATDNAAIAMNPLADENLVNMERKDDHATVSVVTNVAMLCKVKDEPTEVTDTTGVSFIEDSNFMKRVQQFAGIEEEPDNVTASADKDVPILRTVKEEPTEITNRVNNFSDNNVLAVSTDDTFCANTNVISDWNDDAKDRTVDMEIKVFDIKEEIIDDDDYCLAENDTGIEKERQDIHCKSFSIKHELKIDPDDTGNATSPSECESDSKQCSSFESRGIGWFQPSNDHRRNNSYTEMKVENSPETYWRAETEHDHDNNVYKINMNECVESESASVKKDTLKDTREQSADGSMDQHLPGSAATEKKVYTCGICNKEFVKRSSLRSHIITHTGETPYTCQYCKKGFNVRSNLNVHLLIHTGERPHQCEICKKTFRQAGQLKSHMLIHKGEKPYVCTVCARAFRNSSALVTHQRTHTGEKPFVCDVCRRSFTTSTSLKTHRVTHSGKMLFDCPLCGKQFNRRNNLNVHIKRHDKNRSFSCPMCRSGFVMRAHLLAHLRQSHKVDVHRDEVKYQCLIDVGGVDMTGGSEAICETGAVGGN